MQYLMGLSDVFEWVRNQILSIELFYCINQAYNLVLQVEIRKQALNMVTRDGIMFEFVATRSNSKSFGNDWREVKKGKLKCKHCNGDSHVV